MRGDLPPNSCVGSKPNCIEFTLFVVVAVVGALSPLKTLLNLVSDECCNKGIFQLFYLGAA